MQESEETTAHAATQVNMGSMFSSKEGLEKKDDDHRPTRTPSIRSQWTAATGAPKRKMLKRLAFIIALAVFVYLFIKNLPTDLPVRDRRRPVYHPELGGEKSPAPGPMPKLKPDRKPQRPLPPYSPPASDNAPPTSGYNGPLKFEQLLPSLQAIHSTGGTAPFNKNVLFAAASLKSAALLLPMACQMGMELRNYVHFALIGGSEIDMEKLRAVNGIGESCEVIFHDARPDFAAASKVERLRQSSARALRKSQHSLDRNPDSLVIDHINKYMHPQALLVDVSGMEEDYFLASIRKQAPISGIPLIELPEHAPSRLGWIVKLDSSSLAGKGTTRTRRSK